MTDQRNRLPDRLGSDVSLAHRHKLVCGVHNARLALICAVRWRGDGFVVASSDSDQKNATTGD